MKDVSLEQMNKTETSSVKSIIKLHEKVKKDGLEKDEKGWKLDSIDSKDGCS